MICMEEEVQNRKRKIRVSILIALLLACMVIVGLLARSKPSNNPYFFEKGIAEQEYEGYIYPLSSREIREKVTLKITELEQFQSGELYALELEQLEVTDTEDMISMGRQYLGYFYVKDSQIYRLPVKDYSGFTEEQTQNTVKAIRNDEKSFLDMCHIVCSEEEIVDTVDDQGYHSGIKADGNKRTYYFYHEDTSGTKDYEKIVWEKEKGIVYYQRGAGNMLMHIEFGVDLEEWLWNKPENQQKQDISVSESVIEKVLLEKVPELYAYEEYIQKESSGQAGLCIQIYELTEVTDDRFLKEGKYYPIYVGEGWEKYNVNWDWFYVNQDLETIYWYDIVEGMFYSLDEWRISDKYRKLTGNELRQDIDYELYMEFLEGSRSVNGMMITDITTPTREPDKHYFTEYTFSDSDTDGLDELHIRSERYYYIIDCENDELSVWKDLHPRTELLNNGDYLYTHIGGAPLHHDYKYFSMGPEGEEVWSITYNWYDENSNGEFDEEDLYVMQNTNVLSYEEWKEVQENYLNVGTDKVWWRVLEEETSKTEDSQEVIELLTKEEVLQMVFDYEYASWENLVDVTCYETDDVVGYKWLTENNMRYPMYLTVSEIVTTSQGSTYGIVQLAKDIYSTSGVYFRTETYNEFAVNMDTGEIIEMRVYLDEGGWEYSEEYRKKVLGDK